MRTLRLLAVRFLVPAAAVLAPAATAVADGLIVIRPEPPDMPHIRTVPLWTRNHHVTVKVKDRVAVTEVDQVFVNPNPRQLEGTYIFPLPKGATIDRFSMWIDGKEMSAELLDAQRARTIYEDIVRQTKDPALLEYSETGLFRARIFPIEANGEKRVRISYAEILSADNGTVAYRYPLNTEKFSSRPLETVSVNVTIEAGAPIASIFSPSHKIDTPDDLRRASPVRVGWEERNVTPDRDFLLYWRSTHKDVGISAIAHRDPADPEGTFLLVIAPGEREEASIPKDVVFVVDTSGSMADFKMSQMKAALRYCLRSLGPDDRFGLVAFSTEPRPFRDALLPANAENRAAAERFVDALEARGGTAIDDALRTGLGMLPPRGDAAAGRPTFVLFMTDGLPTIGESDPDAIVKRASQRAADARIFVFGVGHDVNTRLLDRLAEEHRGTRDYVAETESIEEKVSNLYAKLSKPAMTDLELRVDGVATEAVHPRRLGDLFHGGELLVVGRYREGGNAVVRLRGRVRGEVREIVEELRLPASELGNEFLPRLWAVRRVAFLLDEIRLRGESGELRDEVVVLAKRYGIVTPYTSYLILEDAARPVPVGRAPAPATPWTLGFGGRSGGGGGGDAGAAAGAAPAAPAEDRALDAARREAEQTAEAKSKDSGEGAVDLARERVRLGSFGGARDDDDEAGASAASSLVRHVAGRTFVTRGGVWWDADVDLRKERRVVDAFSDAYFELVRKYPKAGRWLALGDVVLVLGDEVVEVRRTR